MKQILDTGNSACAMAVKLAEPEVIAAYPITPQTSISEKLASYVAEGELNARYIPVESEHSAISAVAAASAAGARVFTATSSQGLLYMHEILHYIAGGRLPVVLVNVNRAVNAPWCLYVDHQDTVSQRDTGWMQLYAGDNQEIHDFTILAYRIAEECNLPVMVCYDGFLLSHSMAPFEALDKKTVKQFLPERELTWCLHPSMGRATFGSVTPALEYSEFRAKLAEDIVTAADVYRTRSAQLDLLTGHHSGGYFSTYRTEGAKFFILSMGSMAVEAEVTVDRLREQGIAAAGLRLKLFRPFPGAELSRLLPDGARLLVLDRNHAYGTGGGALLQEAKAALYARASALSVAGRSVGVGGVDLDADRMAETVRALIRETEGQ